MDRGIPKSRPGCVSEVELDVANKEKIAAVGVGSGSRTRNRVRRIYLNRNIKIVGYRIQQNRQSGEDDKWKRK
jgi:hypothetical protein